ncbi:hypothetical protein MLD52_22580 [Puniceicoccaceae bacterium K14]|nr:hypothetical protein [Puniceicoccaceae bacterium K14]
MKIIWYIVFLVSIHHVSAESLDKPYVIDALAYFEIEPGEETHSNDVKYMLLDFVRSFKSKEEFLKYVANRDLDLVVRPIVFQTKEKDLLSFRFYYPSEHDTLMVHIFFSFKGNKAKSVHFSLGSSTIDYMGTIQEMRLNTDEMNWGFQETARARENSYQKSEWGTLKKSNDEE